MELALFKRATRIFQVRGSFVELGHFDKFFVKNTRKKSTQGKILELFLLDTLKTTFGMEDSTQGWRQLGPFFPKSLRTCFFHTSYILKAGCLNHLLGVAVVL